MSNNPNECGVMGPESCWSLEGNVWVYTTSHGNTKTGVIPGAKVTGQLVSVSDTECVFQIFVNKVLCDTINLTPLLDKIADTTLETSFDPDTCDFTTTVDGIESVVNFSELLSSLCVEFEGQELVLRSKNGECRVTLPRHVIDVDINVAECTQIVSYSDGTTDTQPYLDAITLEKTDSGIGMLSIKGVTCPIHPPVVIPADVKITGIRVVEGPDGTFNIVVDVSDGTTLNGGPIIDTDTWTVVADNGDGTGTVTAPDGTNCTFVKGVQSTAVANPDGTITVTQNDGTQVTNAPSTVTANPAGTGGGAGTATITMSDGTVKDDAVCGVQSTAVANADGSITVTQNDGTQVTNTPSSVVDNGDGTGTVTMADGSTCTFLKTVTIPADVRVTGISFVESADGASHTIQLTLSDGSTLDGGPVIDTDTWTTVLDNGDGTGTVTAPDGATCDFVKGVQSTVVDNGNGTGTLTQNDGTTCDFVKQVSAGTFTCEEDPEFDDTLILNVNGSRIRFGVQQAEESGPFNFSQTNGTYMFSDSFPDGSPASVNGATFQFPGVYNFSVNNCKGNGCVVFEGIQQHLLVPATGGIVGMIVFSEHQLCDAVGTPISGWTSNGVGGNYTAVATDRDSESSFSMPFKFKICPPNGDYQVKMRLRMSVLKGYTTAGWSLRTQTSTFTEKPQHAELYCCDLPEGAPLLANNTEIVDGGNGDPLAQG